MQLPSETLRCIFKHLECQTNSLGIIAAQPQQNSMLAIVCDSGNPGPRYIQHTLYDEDAQSLTVSVINLDGSPAPAPVGSFVICDDDAELALLLAALNNILTQVTAINIDTDFLTTISTALAAILDELQNQTAQTPGLLQGHTVVLDTVSNTEQLVTAAGVGADSVTIHNTSAVWVRATFADFGAEVINGNKVIIMAPASTKSMTFKRNSIESVSFVEVEPPTVTSQASVNQVVPAAATVAGIILVDFFEE